MRRALVAALVAAGCAHSTPPEPTQADATRSGHSLADLTAGRTLLMNHCGGCHVTPTPSSHTAAEWPAILVDMGARANLGAGDTALVEHYVVTMAKR